MSNYVNFWGIFSLLMEKAIFVLSLQFILEFKVCVISTFISYFYLQHLIYTEPVIGTLFHSMLNMLNLFFNKESSPEDRRDSNFETWTIPQGDDSFFQNFGLNFTQEMRSFSEPWQNFECHSFARSFHHFLLTSAEVFPTNLATNVYRRELNLINQPKTFTLPMVLVSHQIINNRSNSQCWVCA